MTSNDRFQRLVDSILKYVPQTPAVTPAEKAAVASITF